MATVEKALNRYRRPASSGDKGSQDPGGRARECFTQLDQGKPVRALDLAKEEWVSLKQFCLITAKPVLYAANVAENGFENNPHPMPCAHAAAEKPKWFRSVPRSKPRSPIWTTRKADVPRRPRAGRTGPGSPDSRRLPPARSAQTYFTAGVKEVRAWTIHQGAIARRRPPASFTPISSGFIRAQTIAFDDFVKFGGEQGAKEAGKMRAEGKEYVVQDGDVPELPVQRLIS